LLEIKPFFEGKKIIDIGAGEIPFMYLSQSLPYSFRRFTPSGLKYVLEESKF